MLWKSNLVWASLKLMNDQRAQHRIARSMADKHNIQIQPITIDYIFLCRSRPPFAAQYNRYATYVRPSAWHFYDSLCHFGVFDTNNSHEIYCTGFVVNNVKCSIEFNWCIIFNFRCELSDEKQLVIVVGTVCSVLLSQLHTCSWKLEHDDAALRMWRIARALRKSINCFISIVRWLLFISNLKSPIWKKLLSFERTALRRRSTPGTFANTENHSKTRRTVVSVVGGVRLSHRRNCR